MWCGLANTDTLINTTFFGTPTGSGEPKGSKVLSGQICHDAMCKEHESLLYVSHLAVQYKTRAEALTVMAVNPISSVCLCVPSMPMIYWLHPYQMFHYTGQKRTRLCFGDFSASSILYENLLETWLILLLLGFFSLFDEVIVSGMTLATLGYDTEEIQKIFCKNLKKDALKLNMKMCVHESNHCIWVRDEQVPGLVLLW